MERFLKRAAPTVSGSLSPPSKKSKQGQVTAAQRDRDASDTSVRRLGTVQCWVEDSQFLLARKRGQHFGREKLQL